MTLGATMFVAFGLLALLVAAVGLDSVIAYGVSQPTRKIAIRLALGATRQGVHGFVLRVVVCTLLVVVVLATCLPVRAAMRLDPNTVLRAE